MTITKTLAETKILIPEIPAHWTSRLRSGHINTWKHPDGEISLSPPEQGLYAERFEDGWYWICGCGGCLGKWDEYSYIVCHEHNRCKTCGIHRDDIDEIPWGSYVGFQCRTCRKKEHDQEKDEAITAAIEDDHSEHDCWNRSEIICPVCATVKETDELHDAGSHTLTCEVCDEPFTLEVEYEIRYTTTKLERRVES